MIEQLEADACRQLAAISGLKARASAAADLNGNRVEVFARRTHRGTTALGYGYCGVRLERHCLLLLLCPEAACPQHEAARKQWQQRSGQVSPKARAVGRGLEVASLFVEVPVQAGNRTCIARPASFLCLTPCPVGAHAPRRLGKSGWDLFEDGKYLAGGLSIDPETRRQEPVLPTIDAARTWLLNPA